MYNFGVEEQDRINLVFFLPSKNIIRPMPGLMIVLTIAEGKVLICWNKSKQYIH